MKIISIEELISYLEKLQSLESKDTKIDLLTKESFGKSYKCGCGSNHIFNNDTGIIWRRKLGAAFVLVDKSCNYANYIEQEGFFSVKMKTIYSAIYDKALKEYKKFN
jgi:hypothetical protein